MKRGGHHRVLNAFHLPAVHPYLPTSDRLRLVSSFISQAVTLQQAL